MSELLTTAGTAAAGPLGGLAGSILGNIGGAGGGSGVSTPNNFGATSITFGSSNFKSAGAGDAGKSSGIAGAAADAALASAGYGSTGPAGASILPAWLWVVIFAGLAVLGFVAFKKTPR